MKAMMHIPLRKKDRARVSVLNLRLSQSRVRLSANAKISFVVSVAESC